ncbi:dihydroneopterin aldolase [Microscilla marina]|uniref:7,8-dihydroneopterin aldolase n=1 Tax=Microscilla marina ATCC 23134 TaxID=313606 RepID=A1ZKN0_MICM2|nr:dihydroneopterin aldolase [Microscilla marina]EAY29256.1 dihydroneopterin aldolase [Microscilla marina ATCC 23134]
MGLIALEGLEFFAYHGVYQEEQKIGNKYRVDITIETDFLEAAKEDTITATVHYGEVYELVKAIMKQPSKLLESLAYRIVEATHEKYPNLTSVEASVAKFNPPVGGVCKWAKVTHKR